MNHKAQLRTRFSRRSLNIIILMTSLMIILFYNLPGSREQPLPSKTTQLSEQQSKALFGEKTDSQSSQHASEAQLKHSEPTEASLSSLALIENKPPKTHSIDIISWNTSKGAKVLFVEAHEVPMLDVRLVFDAGAARDAGMPGLAYMTNAMLNEGTAKYTVDEIARHFESVGAQFENGSYRDMAVAAVRTLSKPEIRDASLTMLREVVTGANMPQENFERLRAQVQLSLRREQQSPRALIGNAFFERLYGDNPYAHNKKGSDASLTTMSRQDLLDFHQRFYVAANAVIAIVGDITETEARAIAEQWDQALPGGTPAPRLPSPGLHTQAVEHNINFPSQQAHIMVGAMGVKRGDPRWYALQVGNEILGGGGFSSRLNKIIRQEQGLAYSVYSYFSPMAVNGPFIMGLQTRNDQAEKALALLEETFALFVSEGPSETEVADAKQHLLNSFPLSVASNSNIVDNLGAIGFYDLPLDYLDQYPQQISKISVAAIKEAFSSLTAQQKLLKLVLKPPLQTSNHEED